ncbi:rod shape-determining protein RodA [Roseofilum capinflatum]|uniref:Peptidoglycan glycosyltransferase RodA n=1 Tax=Roseofilum capinflatum BLCC-M114 TaxID=3022440 RepID=A0ABT7B6I9_9CYAN|nr:rod shape-determining protein RodA [Roseofilum capinflatum]MDJ1174229.1 rod shape-determining protein RodA [Roseofilum capinflatum BLCC-M114]
MRRSLFYSANSGSRIRWLSLLSSWKNLDWFLLILVVGLTLFGGIMIRSTQLNLEYTDWVQHWIIGGMGCILALFISRWRYQQLIQWQWIIYGITNVSLLAVIFVGTTALGAQRWITIGGFNIQPSEFAKLGVIITLASLLHSKGASTLSGLFKTLAIVGVPWALVFLQPDLGTSLVFGAIALGMLYWANTNPSWLILLISPIVSAILFNLYLPAWFAWAGLLVLLAWTSLPWPRIGAGVTLALTTGFGFLGEVFWGLLKDYQKDRLILFLDPEKDPLGGGYHLIQSRIAIGSGQLHGTGLYQGTQTQLHFIPEQHTDFIFSAVGEELGFIGAAILLVVFWLICFRLVMIAQNAKDNFGSLLAIGVLSMIVFQVMVNIGMTIGLAPVTGIPLPWMSYGRSALLTNFLAIGLVEAVANYRHRLKF